MSTAEENKSFSEKEKACFFCKNNWQFRKKRFTHHHHLTAFVCIRCLKSLGGIARVQQVLDETSYPYQDLNYKSEERRERLLKSAGAM